MTDSYEPDPKKAKVLYESKILECCVGKDPSGRKCPQYLVHFYGWNSSWDRIVRESDIVKDNTENRALQRSLAEKAAVGLKGKKLKLNKIPAIIKEIVINSGSASSQSSPKEDKNDDSIDMEANPQTSYDSDELTQDDTDQHSGSSDDYQSVISCRTSVRTSVSNELQTQSESNPCDESDSQTPIYSLPQELKVILDQDYRDCCQNGILYELPIRPNVSQIIEEFSLNNSFLISNQIQTETEENENQILIEFKSSLEIYFNALAENNYLFYTEEEKQQLRRQLSHHRSDDNQLLEANKIYGFVHLLRLLVAMTDFLASTPGMTKKQLRVILKLIQQFIDYLNKRRHHFQ